MGRTALRILLVSLAALVMLYLSRFWPVELWPRGGLLADWGLRPQGGLIRFWLRGTPLAGFDLIVWVVAGFLVLSLVEKLCAKIAPGPDDAA